MKIPTFRRIIVEDYPAQYRDVISKLAYSINAFMDTLNIALNANLSINDNTTQVQKIATIVVNQDGTPTTGGTIKTDLNGLCGGTAVINTVNTTNVTRYPSTTPFITFTNGTNGTIIINNITGLKPNNSYNLTIIFYPQA